MRYTLSEKILAAHAGLDEVRAGQFVDVAVDIVLSNDITAPIAIREFEKLAGDGAPLKVFDPERVVMVADHFAPNKDIESAEQWEAFLEMFWKDAEQLAQHVEKMSEEELQGDFVDAKYGTYQRNIDGMIEHSYYHLGQISLVKKAILHPV